jgi:putative salt-induced outer membrane protein YdiY
MFKLFISLLLVTSTAMAEDKLGLTNESSLGYVVTGGNSQSETTSAKHTSVYSWTQDILKFNGQYLQTSGYDKATAKTNQTAENWMANIRLERILVPKKFNLYLEHGWYGNRFQGVREGLYLDFGPKYFWVNSDDLVFFSELGYRYSRELLTVDPTNGGLTPEGKVGVGKAIMPEYHQMRLKSQIDYSHSKTLALGAWVEYLPSITNFNDDQRINYSPYMTSVLTDMFSLKVAYEGRYRFKQPVAGNKLTDYTFTTSLIAKF